jgi:hypothetical protein
MVGPTCWAWMIQDCDGGGLWQQGPPSPFTFLIDVRAIKHEAYWSQPKYLNIIILCDGCVSHWIWILGRLVLCWWNKSDTWYMIPADYGIPVGMLIFSNWYPYPYWKLALPFMYGRVWTLVWAWDFIHTILAPQIFGPCNTSVWR